MSISSSSSSSSNRSNVLDLSNEQLLRLMLWASVNGYHYNTMCNMSANESDVNKILNDSLKKCTKFIFTLHESMHLQLLTTLWSHTFSPLLQFLNAKSMSDDDRQLFLKLSMVLSKGMFVPLS